MKRGFTSLELLVVLIVVLILFSMGGYFLYSRVVQGSKAISYLSFLSEIESGAKRLTYDTGCYVSRSPSPLFPGFCYCFLDENPFTGVSRNGLMNPNDCDATAQRLWKGPYLDRRMEGEFAYRGILVRGTVYSANLIEMDLTYDDGRMIYQKFLEQTGRPEGDCVGINTLINDLNSGRVPCKVYFQGDPVNMTSHIWYLINYWRTN